MKLALTISVLLLGTSMVALLGLTVAYKLVRILVEHRQKLIRDVLRKSLILFLSGDSDLKVFDNLIRLKSDQLEQVSENLLTKIRGEARDTLIELLEKRGAIEDSIERTSHGGAVRRCRAAAFLGNTGVAKAREPLERLLNDRSREVRITAARALGRLSDPEAVPQLLDSLDRPKRSIPFATIVASLVRIGPPGTLYLLNGLNSSGGRERAAATEIVGLLCAVEAVPILVEHLTSDPVLDVQIRCARALGRIGAPKAIDPLISTLTAVNPIPLRIVSCGALAQIGGSRVLEELIQLVGDSEALVAAAAAKALSDLGVSGLESLRLIAENHGPGEIYAKEFIARQTVKRHYKFDNQQVQSRIRASQ